MNPEPLRELEAVVAEMRARRVNHGKFTSPTLEAWANRISSAIAQLDDGNLTHFRPFPIRAQDQQP